MLLRQGLVFVIVGGVLVVVDWAVFVALSAAGLPSAPANVLGRLAGALLGFFLNGSLTFRGGQGARLGRLRFARFSLVWIALTLSSTALVTGITTSLGLRYAWVAKPVIEACMALVSFVVCRQWVFR